MAASKKTYQDITEKDLAEYQENKFQEYMEEEQEWDDFIYSTNEWDRTVQQQENIVCELLDKAEEGSELEAYCTLKQIKKLLDEAIKQVEPEALTKCELEAPDNSSFKKAGFEIQKRNGGKIIDFSNVPEVAEKESELKKFKEILKHALTGVEKGATMLSEGQMVLSDGELINLPQWKYKKDSIVIKKL